MIVADPGFEQAVMRAKLSRPPIQVLVYGSPGEGKSHFLATFPKPMLVLSFDPSNKNRPYFKRGAVAPAAVEGEYGQEIWTVMSRKDPEKLLVSVEVIGGEQFGRAFQAVYTHRVRDLYDEVREGRWASVILDSFTGAELGARMMYRDVLMPQATGKEWSQGTTDVMESLMLNLLSLRSCNVCFACHIDKDRDEVLGRMVGMPSAPGRLQRKDGLSSRFAEIYRIHAKRDKDSGEVVRYLQTQSDERFNATSVFLEAPDPCAPTYAALWQNWEA